MEDRVKIISQSQLKDILKGNAPDPFPKDGETRWLVYMGLGSSYVWMPAAKTYPLSGKFMVKEGTQPELPEEDYMSAALS